MIPPVPERPALFLDFDGTLVDIVDRPDGVTVAHDLPAVIDALARVTGGAVAVVTGRKIEDVDRHLSLPIAAAGMHRLRKSKPCANASSPGRGAAAGCPWKTRAPALPFTIAPRRSGRARGRRQ